MINLFYRLLEGYLTVDCAFEKLGKDKEVVDFTVAHTSQLQT